MLKKSKSLVFFVFLCAILSFVNTLTRTVRFQLSLSGYGAYHGGTTNLYFGCIACLRIFGCNRGDVPNCKFDQFPITCATLTANDVSDLPNCFEDNPTNRGALMDAYFRTYLNTQSTKNPKVYPFSVTKDYNPFRPADPPQYYLNIEQNYIAQTDPASLVREGGQSIGFSDPENIGTGNAFMKGWSFKLNSSRRVVI